jgi:hypothetical protein
MELGGEGKGNENDRQSTVSKHIASVHVDNIIIYTKSC